MTNKFFEFIATGLLTPIIYLGYSVVTILFTFVIGLPIAIGCYFIELAIKFLLQGG